VTHKQNTSCKSAAAVDKTLPDQRVFNEQGQAIRPSTMTPSSEGRGSVARVVNPAIQVLSYSSPSHPTTVPLGSNLGQVVYSHCLPSLLSSKKLEYKREYLDWDPFNGLTDRVRLIKQKWLHS